MAHVLMTHPQLGEFKSPERYVKRAEERGFKRVEGSPAKPPSTPRKTAAKKTAPKKATAKKQSAAKKTTTPTAGDNNA